MNRPLHRLFCLCLILFLIPATGQAAVFNALDVDQAQSMNEIVPVLETRVLDEAMLLSASEQIRVAQQIAAFQLPCIDQVLPQQGDVVQDANRHPFIRTPLELK